MGVNFINNGENCIKAFKFFNYQFVQFAPLYERFDNIIEKQLRDGS